MLPPSVVSPIGDVHEQSMNDDIFARKNALPVPLNSDFACHLVGSDRLDVVEG